jgi:hypothetical protein
VGGCDRVYFFGEEFRQPLDYTDLPLPALRLQRERKCEHPSEHPSGGEKLTIPSPVASLLAAGTYYLRNHRKNGHEKRESVQQRQPKWLFGAIIYNQNDNVKHKILLSINIWIRATF